MMNQQILDVTDLVIVIVAQAHNPRVVNHEFLKYSGIVADEWELARQPVYNNQLVKISYQNKLTITSQSNRIIFAESIKDKEVSQIVAPNVARKYVETLPNIEYKAVGINPIGYFSFGGDDQAVRQYYRQELLANRPWQEFGSEPMTASLNLNYTLETGRLNLNITEGQLQQPEDKQESVILFSGNVEHNLTKDTQQEKLLELQQYLAAWQTDLETYKELINTKFATAAISTAESESTNLFTVASN
ncbi:hypothetical protein [Moorena producens]|uniref:hypothetical protein n=1 Tax=Moorena producens TaxID=1155739 RepID=UPI003C759B92